MDPRPNQHQLYFPFEKKVSKENIGFFSPYRLPNSKYYNRFPRNVKSKFKTGDPYGNRTHVCGVRGRRLNRLTNGPSSERTAYRSFRPSAKTHSFRRSSSSSRTRFAGLRSELRGNCFLWSHLGRSCIPSGTWCAFRDSNPGPTD